MPHIIISRISRISYSVKIPATDSQIALLKRVNDEFVEKWKRDKKEKDELERQQEEEDARIERAARARHQDGNVIFLGQR